MILQNLHVLYYNINGKRPLKNNNITSYLLTCLIYARCKNSAWLKHALPIYFLYWWLVVVVAASSYVAARSEIADRFLHFIFVTLTHTQPTGTIHFMHDNALQQRSTTVIESANIVGPYHLIFTMLSHPCHYCTISGQFLTPIITSLPHQKRCKEYTYCRINCIIKR